MHVTETMTRRRATTTAFLLFTKLPSAAAAPENCIVGLEGGRPAASGFPPDFRLHRSGRKSTTALANESNLVYKW